MLNIKELHAWLAHQSYNTWCNYIVRVETDLETIPAPPTVGYLGPQFRSAWNETWSERASSPYVRGAPDSLRTERLFTNERGRWRVPNRLDVMDFGNEKVYCALGAYAAETHPDLSRVIKLCGPQKRDIPLSPPHYDLPGGNAYQTIKSNRCLVFAVSYHHNGKDNACLFRHCDSQVQRRVSGTGLVVTTVTDGRVEVEMLDFAPLDPSLSLTCRVFTARNLTDSPITGLSLATILTSSEPWQDVAWANGALTVTDPAAGHGVLIYAPGMDCEEEGTTLLDGEPEMGWQNIVLATAPIDLAPGTSGEAWLALVPLVSSDDPEQEKAAGALESFSPLEAADVTARAWTEWSSRVSFESDSAPLTDLVDNLQVLLKTHEGVNGYHLGTTYQRHTHGWVRDNCLIQRGLLAGGRVEEARKNLDGFSACWEKSGVAVGYHVFSRRDWSPRPTAELYAYLILMVRDYHLWVGNPDLVKKYWPMVEECADRLYTNDRGLAGFDGDEIWYWELDQERLWKAYGDDRSTLDQASVLDNCWLAIAALTYAAREAGARGEKEKDETWTQKRDRIAQAVEARMWSEENGCYHSLLMPDGRPYHSPFVNGLCTPQFWGVAETREGSLAAGVRHCWDRLHISEGLVRGNTETSTYAGLTPPFFLHALSSLDANLADSVLQALLRQMPSSGGIWEYTVVECPVTFTDKRRAGDSGVLLAAVLHYLFGFVPTPDGFRISPHMPSFCKHMRLAGLVYRGINLSLTADETGTRVERDGKPWIKIPAGHSITYEIASNKLDEFEQKDLLGSK